jgi:hypothetical protein
MSDISVVSRAYDFLATCERIGANVLAIDATLVTAVEAGGERCNNPVLITGVVSDVSVMVLADSFSRPV